MSTYWAILEKVRGSTLRLTKMDDEIYEHLKTDFPEFDPAKTIDEDEMKSKTGKERWRKFLMAYEKKVDDYNFGTMMRANPKWEYGQDETIFGKWLLNTFHWRGEADPSSPSNAVLCYRDRAESKRIERLDIREQSEGASRCEGEGWRSQGVILSTERTNTLPGSYFRGQTWRFTIAERPGLEYRR